MVLMVVMLNGAQASLFPLFFPLQLRMPDAGHIHMLNQHIETHCAAQAHFLLCAQPLAFQLAGGGSFLALFDH